MVMSSLWFFLSLFLVLCSFGSFLVLWFFLFLFSFPVFLLLLFVVPLFIFPDARGVDVCGVYFPILILFNAVMLIGLVVPRQSTEGADNMPWPYDNIRLETETDPQIHLEDEATGEEQEVPAGQTPAAVTVETEDDPAAKTSKRKGATKSHKKGDRPAVPAQSVRTIIGIVEALNDGYVPVAKLVAESSSNDVYTLASALTELKTRRRMQQLVETVQRFIDDEDDDRRTDMALAMKDDKSLAKALFAVVDAVLPDEQIGHSAGAGKENQDSKRLAAVWPRIDVSGLRKLVY